MVPFTAVPAIEPTHEEPPPTRPAGRCRCADCDARHAIDEALERVGAEVVTIVRRAKKYPRWKVGIALADERGIATGEGAEQSEAMLRAIRSIDVAEGV